VRDPLVETAKPWKNPAATFAAPMPIISWFGSNSSPRRAAKLDAVAIVSVGETSTMPMAASSNGTTSLSEVHGRLGVGRPLGGPDGGHSLRGEVEGQGDVITGIDGKGIDSASALTHAMTTYSPNDTVQITWTDSSGSTHHASVHLSSGPPA
jgi:hypothetical protein